MSKKLGVYICGGCSIGASIDTEKLVKVATRDYKAPVCQIHPFLCGPEGVEMIRRDLASQAVDTVVVAACSPRMKTAALRASGAAGSVLPNLVPALVLILAHKRFGQCSREKSRYWGHLLTPWGLASLAIMGTVVGIGSMFGLLRTPLEMSNPLKIFASFAAAVILLGCLLLLLDRLRDPVKRAASTYFDWLFLLTLFGVVVTGILSQFLRLAQVAAVMCTVYFVHLVLIVVLLLYAPYSRFAHLAYRTLAVAAGRKP